MKRRVVITGIGPVTATGTGREQFFEGLLRPEPCIAEIPAVFEGKYRFKSRYYVPFPEFQLADFGLPRAYGEAMEEIARLAVVCAKLAIVDAGLTLREKDKFFEVTEMSGAAVILGVGMPSLETALQSYLAHRFDPDPARGIGGRYNRMVIPMLMPNSASSWVSILFGCTGVNYTVNASCASGTMAIGEAYRKIADGYCTVALTGGVEALKEEYGAIMRGFDMLGALTRSATGEPEPFSHGRSGFLFSEGAGCVLVLEELEQAERRGARIYAEICGFAANSDAYNIVQMEPAGNRVAELLRELTADRQIDYLNAHGTGTVLNDEVEARVIQTVFGAQASQPLINSTKGILGHSIGASGAVEAAVTALSLQTGKVHANRGGEPLEGLNLVREVVEADLEYGLTVSYGFGGHNAGLVLRRYQR